MSHKAREIVGKHPSRVQEGCLFFEQIWGCCSTQPRKKLFFATIIRVKGIGGRYVVHMMPALLVHSLVAVAEKRKALCVSKATAYFAMLHESMLQKLREACCVCAVRWGSNWGWSGYIWKKETGKM